MGLLSVLGGIAGSLIPIPGIGTAAGAMIGSALGGAFEGQESAGQAANIQSASAQGGIDEQRRQFDALQKLLQPYAQAGQSALGGLAPYANAGAPALAQQQALLGLGGSAAQQSAINALQQSPQFTSMLQQGENAMLQNASATGGLRGGNTQAALAQFRPALLAQTIQDQYARLGGMTALGQNTNQNIAQLGQSAAAGVGSAGMQTGSNIANLMGQQGAAQAGGALAQNQFGNTITGSLGLIQGMGGFGRQGGSFQDVGGVGSASNSALSQLGIF